MNTRVGRRKECVPDKSPAHRCGLFRGRSPLPRPGPGQRKARHKSSASVKHLRTGCFLFDENRGRAALRSGDTFLNAKTGHWTPVIVWVSAVTQRCGVANESPASSALPQDPVTEGRPCVSPPTSPSCRSCCGERLKDRRQTLRLLDHLVGACQQCLGHRHAHRLSGLEVDH